VTPAPSEKVKNAKLRAARPFALRGSMARVTDVLFGFHPSGCG
jgi:hypothetical protein